MPVVVIPLVLTCVALGVAGQLAMKYGVGLSGQGGGSGWAAPWRLLQQPMVLVGLGLYAASSLLWLTVLSRAPLSVAYPMLSLGYVGVALLSRWLFAEPLSPLKVWGILLVCTGVALLAQGSR